MKRALLIGLNYKGTDYSLDGCEADIRDISSRMLSKGVKVTQIKDEDQLGAVEFLYLLEQFSKIQTNRDTFYLYYSGHGTQLYNRQERDRYDEALCLNKGGIEVVTDDALRAVLNKFKGTVIVFLDSCFSGGMERTTFPYSKKVLPSQVSINQSVEAEPQQVTTRLMYVCGCAEDEVSYDLGTNGAFTASLVKFYDQNKRTLKSLINSISRDIQQMQHPLIKAFNGASLNRIVF